MQKLFSPSLAFLTCALLVLTCSTSLAAAKKAKPLVVTSGTSSVAAVDKRTAVTKKSPSLTCKAQRKLAMLQGKYKTPVSPIQPPVTATPKPAPLSLTLSFAGDCTLGEFLNMGYGGTFAEYYDMYGSAWAFGNVKDIFAADDVTYVNLEGPLTNYPQKEDEEKQFPIKGDIRNVNCLVDGSIEVCNLANNHMLDCGYKGMQETEQVLAEAGIAYCGGTSSVTYQERKGVKIAFIGLDGWNTYDYTLNAVSEALAEAKSQEARLLIVQFHWGIEREYTHNATQEALAHYAIDAGADIVVGAHPHVLQDTEIYNGKLICYSMGNFSFGANVNPKDKDSVIIQQTFIDGPNGFTYGPTKYIPCRISSVATYNDFRPTPYTEQEDKERVLTKLNQN